MKDDPVVTRIRAARHAISARHGHDPRRLVAYYVQLQERHADRLLHHDERRVTAARVAEERDEYA